MSHAPIPTLRDRRTASVLALLLTALAGASGAQEPPYPSPEWSLREAANYSRTLDAAAIQADPAFQQRWQQQSFVNSQEYLAREREDDGWNSRGNACKEWAEQCTGDPYRYPGWDSFYEAEGRVEPVIFFDAEGARLSGRVWVPIASQPGDALPLVVINNGSVQVPETAYWWAAQMLVRNGYAVMSFDPRGQGRSDNRTPDGQAGSNANPVVFVSNLVDAVDFALSTPQAPYVHNLSDTHAPATPYNPFWDRVDRGRVGLAGHSLGARGVSVVQGLDPWPGTSGPDNPVDVIVAWDNLAAAGAAGQFTGDIGEYVPRVPAMGQSADYWLTPQPKLQPPDPLEKSPGMALWRDAGVPVFQIQIRGGTHYEWSLMPTLPTSAWEPGGDGGWGQPLVRHYTLAWFDRWLKRPGEPGYADADQRLLDDAAWRAKMSFYYRSGRDYPSRDGQRRQCVDLLAGCDADVAAGSRGDERQGSGTLGGALALLLAGWLGRRRALRCAASMLLAVGLSACVDGGSVPPPGASARAQPRAVQVRPLQLTVDGELATGLVFVPGGGAEPERLITFCHGHGETAADFRAILTELAGSTGALIVAMDYRNAPGNEDGDYNLLRGYQDTVAATRWALQAYPGLRSSDLWGWSMGGFVSGMALAYDPELYRYWVASFPGVNAAGAWALFTALGVPGLNDDAQELENDAGCSFLACPEAYVARSPSLLADRMAPERAFILHGLFDPVSPYEQGREMFFALVANGIPASFYSFVSQTDGAGNPGPAGHGHGTAPALESARLLQRLLAGTEPLAAPIYEYVIDETLPAGLRPPPLPGP